MTRTKSTKKATETKLMKVNERIAVTQQKLEELLKEKEILHSQLEDEELKELREIIIKSGKSIQEVAELIDK